MVLERLINERAQLQAARGTLGIKVEDSRWTRPSRTWRAEPDQPGRDAPRLAADGVNARVPRRLRDQLMLYRLREREVLQRVKVSDLRRSTSSCASGSLAA